LFWALEHAPHDGSFDPLASQLRAGTEAVGAAAAAVPVDTQQARIAAASTVDAVRTFTLNLRIGDDPVIYLISP
jgi:hypothetical protein